MSIPTASLLSVHVGRPRTVPAGRTAVTTAIWKDPVAGRVAVRGVNLDGDDQADRSVHGGPDKAVYAYAEEEQQLWTDELGRDLGEAPFGQNLTTRGVDVSTAVIGERWRVGTTLLEVAQPRVPCHKLALRFGEAGFVKRFAAASRPGAYLRIVTEGELGAGDPIEVIDRPDHAVTSRMVFDAMLRDPGLIPQVVTAHQLPAELLAWPDPADVGLRRGTTSAGSSVFGGPVLGNVPPVQVACGGTMRSRISGAVLVAVVAGAAVVAPSAGAAARQTPDQWTSEAAGAGQTYANLGEATITPATAAKLKLAWQAPDGGSFVAPAVVGGKVYRALNPGNANDRATFTAASARTGAREWSVSLPAAQQYYRGQSIAARIAVLPFEGWHTRGGVTAVSLTTHKVLWSRIRPASTTNPGNDDGTGSPIAVDSGRVYLAAGNVLSAYDLKTGRLLWHIEPSAGIKGFAALGGRLYTGDFPGRAGPGLVAYDGATGRKLWTAPELHAQPVVVGSTVLAPTYQGVGSVPAAGCGAATCSPTWTRDLAAEPETILLGGASAGTFFVAYEPAVHRAGRLARINTTTGAVQWTYRSPDPFAQLPIRVGNVVWILVDTRTVKGWSVSTTGTTAVRTITLPPADNGVVGGLAGANGSLLVDIFAGALAAYRVPGS